MGSRRAGFWDLVPTVEEIKEPQQLVHELTQGSPHPIPCGTAPVPRGALSSQCHWLREGALLPKGIGGANKALEEGGGKEMSL